MTESLDLTASTWSTSGVLNRARSIGQRVWSDPVGRGGLIFVVANGSVGLSNFVFHVILSRLLGPTQYGALGALLNVTAVLAVPLSAIQVTVAQGVVRRGDQAATPPLGRLVKVSLVVSVVAFAVWLGITPTVDRFFHLHSPRATVAVGIWLVPTILVSMLEGVLLGQRRFRIAAVGQFAGSGISRLAAGIVLVELGMGVLGGITATVIASVVTLLVYGYALRGALRGVGQFVPRAGDALLSTMSLGGAALLTSIDAWLARHFLTPHSAGLFNAGATAGRIALFFPGAITLVYFPRLASSAGQGTEARRALARCTGLVTFLGFVAAGALALLPRLSIDLLFGPAFSHASVAVGTIAFADAGIGVAGCFVYYQVARRSRMALAPWATCVLALALAAAFHGSMEVLALDMLAASATLVLFLGAVTIVSALRTLADDGASLPRQAILMDEPVLDVSLVVPFRNVGWHRLSVHLSNICDTLAASGFSFEVIPVSDGSTDDSGRALEGLPQEFVRPIVWADNRGKGEALRAGLAHGRGQYLGFIDGDGDIPAALLVDYLALANSDQPEIIVGSKRHAHSKVRYPPLRRLYSAGYQVFTTVLFGLRVRDTQTGVKLVRRDVLSEVLPRMVEKRFAFDLELLAVAHRLGYRQTKELPVTIGERFPSTISPAAVWRMLQDTLATFWRLRVLRFYDPPLVGPGRKKMDQGQLLDALRNGGSLRILVCSWRDLAHPQAGGAEVYTHRVAKAWVSAGHHVTWFCSAVPGRSSYEVVDGIHLVRRGGRLSVYRQARLFYQRQGRGRFDIIFDEVNTRPFAAWRWGADTPVVALVFQLAREVWFHEMWWPLAAIGRFLLEPSWVRQLWRVPVLTISESSKRSMERLGIEDVTVIPPGLSPVPRPDVAREPVPTVLFVGRLARNKRPLHVIEAFRLLRQRLPGARLWVIGTGPLAVQLRSRAPEGVEFLGQVSDHEKFERMARAHCVVSTSVREGWGLVVSEAAQVGTPTVAYDVDGLRDSVTASGGVLVETQPAQLASVLQKLLPIWSSGSLPPVSPGGVAGWDEVGSSLVSKAAERVDARSRQIAAGEDVASAWRKLLVPVATVCDRRAWSTLGIAALVVLAPLSAIGSTAWEGRAAGAALTCLAIATLGTFAEAMQRAPKRVSEEPPPLGGRLPRFALPAVAVAAACGIAAQTWFTGGGAIAGGDVVPPIGTAWLTHLFSAWTWSGFNLGGPNTYAMQLPWAFVLEIVHVLGGSAALAQRVWLTLLFMAVGGGATLLLTSLDFGVVACGAGGLVYAFNAFVVAQSSASSALLTTLALVPILAAWVIRASRAGRTSALMVSLIPIAALLGYVASEPSLLLPCGVAFLGSVLFVAWLYGGERARLALKRAILALGGLLVASAYWLVPLVINGVTTSGQVIASSSWTSTEGRATLANGFWLNNLWDWSIPPYYPYAGGYSRFPLVFLIYVVPVVAFAALGLSGIRAANRERTPRIRLLACVAAVALIMVLLSTGTRTPGSALFDLFYSLPFGWLMADPGRLLFVVALAYAILIAICAERATAQRPSSGPLTAEGAVAAVGRVRLVPVACLLLLLLPGYPLITGAVVPGTRPPFPSEHVAVPRYWSTMATEADRAPSGNLLVLPADDYYQMPYTWYYGSDEFLSNLFDRKIVDPAGQGNSIEAKQSLIAVDDFQAAVLNHSWRISNAIADALDARDLLVRGDIDALFPGRAIASPSSLMRALSSDPYVRRVAKAGPLELFAFAQKFSQPASIVTVETAKPGLQWLGDLAPGSALVTSAPVPGTETLVPVQAETKWLKSPDTYSTEVRLPTGRRYEFLVNSTATALSQTSLVGPVNVDLAAGTGSTEVASLSIASADVVADPPPMAILVSPRTTSRPSLVTEWSTYSDAWQGPPQSRHVLVDGMFNGWLTAGGSSSPPHYSLDGVVEGSALLSAFGCLAILIGVVYRRQRHGRAGPTRRGPDPQNAARYPRSKDESNLEPARGPAS